MAPGPDAGKEAGTATTIPRGGLRDEAAPCPPRVPVRGPDGAIPHFDEIVRVHPVPAFFFRRRTFLVLLAILVLGAVARPTLWMLVTGIVIAVLAEAWRIWAAGTIHKTEELTTGGPYALVRHPLYVGSFFHAVAYCFMSGHLLSFLVVIPLFLLLYRVAVVTEEAMLHELFGEHYAAYSERVPRFVPRLRLPRGGHGRFRWRQVWDNKEYVNVIWVAVLSSLFVAQLILRR